MIGTDHSSTSALKGQHGSVGSTDSTKPKVLIEFMRSRESLISSSSCPALPCTPVQHSLRQNRLDDRLNDDLMETGALYSDLISLERQQEYLNNKFKPISIMEISDAEDESELTSLQENFHQVSPQQMIAEYQALKAKAEKYQSEMGKETTKWRNKVSAFHQSYGLDAYPPEDLLVLSMRLRAYKFTTSPLLRTVVSECEKWLGNVTLMKNSFKKQQEAVKAAKTLRLRTQKRRYLANFFYCFAIGVLGFLAFLKHNV